MKPVGYLINAKHGLEGEQGLYYNYVLASNGVFIWASGPLIRATVLVAPAEVRGLSPLEETVELIKGKIPSYIYDLAISAVCADACHERYLAVTWEGEYRLKIPEQSGSSCKVEYSRLESTILDIHSHGAIKPFFSTVDNEDEQGLRLYMVVGECDTLMPDILMRVGVYGYFCPVESEQVFDV